MVVKTAKNKTAVSGFIRCPQTRLRWCHCTGAAGRCQSFLLVASHPTRGYNANRSKFSRRAFHSFSLGTESDDETQCVDRRGRGGFAAVACRRTGQPELGARGGPGSSGPDL